MVQAVTRDAYRDQIHALLPAGRAWPEEADTTLDDLVQAIAVAFAEIDLNDANLLDEIRPSTTFDLLPEWERVAGLPDSCSVLGSTAAVRRASLLEKLVTKPSLHPSEFERIGRTFGVDITVSDLDQSRAETWAAAQMPAVDVTNGKWRFIWFITIPTSADVQRLNTLSDVDTAFLSVQRNTEMECRLQKANPAHTTLVIEYEPVPRLPALSDRSLARGDNVVLPEADGGDAPLTYSMTDLPTGVTFAPATRTLSAANNAALGAATVTYTVTDADMDTDSGTFVLTVVA